MTPAEKAELARNRVQAKAMSDEELKEKTRRMQQRMVLVSSIYFKQTNRVTKVYEAEMLRRGLRGA